MDIVIRKAKKSDIDSLLYLLEKLFTIEEEFAFDPKRHKKGLNKIIKNDTIGDVIVVSYNKKVIGMVTILYSVSTALGEKVAILEDLVIDEAMRDLGIASQLLSYVKSYLFAKRIKRITLLCDQNNQKAKEFYGKNNFFRSSMVPYRSYL